MKNIKKKHRIPPGAFSFLVVSLFVIGYLLLTSPVLAIHTGGNISPVGNNPAEGTAWNDVIGWIDFDNSVSVSTTKLSGNANSLQTGLIALDCAATPNGNICGGSSGNWFVSNDGNGNLAGWAWSDAIGWVSFCGDTGNGSSYNGSTWVCPGSPAYQVTINTTNGDFSGWAWNDVVGWISFNCNNSGIGAACPPNYKVKTSFTPPASGPAAGTSWLISSTFNTQVVGGAAFNSILWQGSQPAGTIVRFQIASSNASGGPWTYIGPDGTAATYYDPNGPDKQLRLSRVYHNNHQYIRYKVYLEWSGSQSPRVDDVVISYSP